MICKLLGSLLAFGGCVGLGCWYRRQIDLRVCNLEEMVRLMDLMMSEIRYGRATLPECCRLLAKQLRAPYAETLHRIAVSYEEEDGSSFAEGFYRGMAACLKQTAAQKEEAEILLRFAQSSGTRDVAMQLLAMERCLQNLLTVKEKIESEAAGKRRMAVGLGSLGGLLLLVLLL